MGESVEYAQKHWKRTTRKYAVGNAIIGGLVDIMFWQVSQQPGKSIPNGKIYDRQQNYPQRH
jgi:hypothetical protein